MTKRLTVYFTICFLAGVLLGLCLNDSLDTRVKAIPTVKRSVNR